MAWSDVNTKPSGNDSQKKEIKYAKLTSGQTYQGRILDAQPFSRYTHWIPQANDGKGLTVDCCGKATCPICADIKKKKTSGEKQKYSSRQLHAINWLNRATGEVELIDKGRKLFEPLSSLLSELGDLREYDIKIRVTGADKDITYTPIPMAPKALTDAEKALEKYDLNEVSLKVTPEQMQMFMNGATIKDVFGSRNEETTDAATEEQLEVDFTKS